MKAQLRIATKDPFCYIEGTADGTPEDIVQQYGELHQAYWRLHKAGPGVTDKEVDAFVQNMVSGGSNHIEIHEKMNEEQKKWVQIIKRAVKRANYKARE